MKRRRCPAKLNLSLDVGHRFKSGFHELETLMVPVSWYDELTLSILTTPEVGGKVEVRTASAAGPVQLTVEQAYGFPTEHTLPGSLESVVGTDSHTSHIPTDHTNLIVRIATGILTACGIRDQIHFHLCKRIPAGAGLGGASSNAASALILINQAFGLGWSWQALADFSACYGSDIAYFFQSKAAICRGRGEQVTPLELPNRSWIVVIRPPFALATPRVFAELAQQRQAACEVTNQPFALNSRRTNSGVVVKDWRRGFLVQPVAPTNDLQLPAMTLRPELNQVRQTVVRSFPQLEQMSGSGSCWFAVFRHRRQALWARNRLLAARTGRAEVVKPIAS